jgi:hypothetical protein
MLNEAWARAEKVARLSARTGVFPVADTEPDTKALPAKAAEPIQVATFEC